jgi:hypothetical protein
MDTKEIKNALANIKTEILEIQLALTQTLAEYGITDTDAVQIITRSTAQAIAKQKEKGDMEDLHKLWKQTCYGRKLKFRTPVSFCSLNDRLDEIDKWMDVTHVMFFKYQPRKKLLWVMLPEDMMLHGLRDNLQPLTLLQCVRFGLEIDRPTINTTSN